MQALFRLHAAHSFQPLLYLPVQVFQKVAGVGDFFCVRKMQYGIREDFPEPPYYRRPAAEKRFHMAAEISDFSRHIFDLSGFEYPFDP